MLSPDNCCSSFGDLELMRGIRQSRAFAVTRVGFCSGVRPGPAMVNGQGLLQGRTHAVTRDSCCSGAGDRNRLEHSCWADPMCSPEILVEIAVGTRDGSSNQ